MQSREIVKDPFNYTSILHIGAIVLRILNRVLKKEIGVSVDNINIVLSRLC
jgi:hypothetical protein